MLEKGKFEFTPSVPKNIATYNYGIQTAYGLNRKSNLRFRLERIGDGFSTHISFGLKKRLKYNKSAIYLPLSFTRFDDSADILKLIEPTYIHTFTTKKNTGIIKELTISIKALYQIPEIKLKDNILVYNIGLGISSDVDKWVIRPELVFLYEGGGDKLGFVPQFSDGLSIYP